jgi:uncharacterized protein YbjT (DUF2867 family)
MSILITGATGTVGSQIVKRLAASGAEVKALVRQAGKTTWPEGVSEVVGDMGSPKSMRDALKGVRTLFLLNAVVPDEVTQALLTLNLAQAAGINRIVYLSVINADTYTNVPHFTGKYTVERMINAHEIPATILRPAYFMQNEDRLKSVVEMYGVYPMPIGKIGVQMVDVRDIADVAAAELLARHNASQALPTRVIEVVGPELITGESAAKVWAGVLKREIAYGGNDLNAFEEQFATYAPDWMAFDMRLMMANIQTQGQVPKKGAVETMEKVLGRPLRTYQAYVQEVAAKRQ